MMFGTSYGKWVLTACFMLAGLMAASSVVSASPISDIADSLNDGLFGGSNLFAAQAILTAAVMVSVGFVLAMMHLDQAATFIVLFCVLGALTAIGWASPTMLLIAGMIACGMFVQRIAQYWTGSGGPTRSGRK